MHAALVGGISFRAGWRRTGTCSALPDAGGASVAIEAVNSIPLPHQGPQNPLASDTESQVPQAPAKPVERVKEEKPPPDAIALKSRTARRLRPRWPARRTNSVRSRNSIRIRCTAKPAPAVSNPAFSAKRGGQCRPRRQHHPRDSLPAYAAQIQQLVASHWHTGGVDASIRTAPTVIATFD